MASQEALRSITREAAGDLSADQFTFMAAQSDGEVDQVGSAGATAIGVLQNKPAAVGREAEVGVRGVTKVRAGASFAAGVKIQSDAAGLAILAASGDEVLGVSLEAAGASGEIVEMLLGSNHILA